MKKILIITLNPALDISYQIKNFNLNHTFRANSIETPGGKGINVAKVLNILNIPFNITGFLGGEAGHKIKRSLNSLKIKNLFFKIKDDTRNCLAILGDSSQTEILELGPNISFEEQKNFLIFLKKLASNMDIISINGSLPNNIPKDFYRVISNELKNKIIILDTSGLPLKLALETNPFLIKPNKEELEALIGKKINDKDDIILAGKTLKNMGAINVLVSLGKHGAIYIGEEIYEIIIPKVDAVNPVGSGDSCIAGFIYGLYNEMDLENTLKFSMSCGISNALSLKTGNVKLEEVFFFMNKITIHKL